MVLNSLSSSPRNILREEANLITRRQKFHENPSEEGKFFRFCLFLMKQESQTPKSIIIQSMLIFSISGFFFLLARIHFSLSFFCTFSIVYFLWFEDFKYLTQSIVLFPTTGTLMEVHLVKMFNCYLTSASYLAKVNFGSHINITDNSFFSFFISLQKK